MFTNTGLVAHARKALAEKWGYVYGTIGLVLTEAILKQKQAQYSDNINKYIDFIRKNWMGRRTADCVNLIKSYLWWDSGKDNPIYSIKYDKYNNVWLSANGMFQVAKEKGPLNTIPDLPGICVWRNGHIGIYVGSGQVIESKGTMYGVVQTPLKGPGANTWTHWLKCQFIEYIDETAEYKRIIQSHCHFSYPEGVWKAIDTHPYSKDVYRQLAEGFK